MLFSEIYPLVRNFLFQLEPEQAHFVTLKLLNAANYCKILPLLLKKPAPNPQRLFGLSFPNRVGLAAGFDRNAEYINALSQLGFGFIEVGTITPKPQLGNPKPRLFRIKEKEALINRIGFASKGLEFVLKQLKNLKFKGILGINIGKNKDTSNDNALDDYQLLFQHLWPYASYITLNVSSPNTLGLRDLQQPELLNHLLATLKKEQAKVHAQHSKYVPIIIKIAPDLTSNDLQTMADSLLTHKADGVIATNTTLSRPALTKLPIVNERGGLSGRPLTTLSTKVILELNNLLQNKIPIIASGGLMDEKTAQAKLSAGAKLLQVYTGLIYSGPLLIRKLACL